MVRIRVDKFADSNIYSFCKELHRRSLISNSYPEGILDPGHIGRVKSLPPALYAGFDPTADSLHVGNLLILSNLLRGSLFGCNSVALIGGSTALIGDPSGRTSERTALSHDVVRENSKNLVKQLAEVSENAKHAYHKNVNLTIINNNEWFGKMSMVDFLRIGKSFRVSEMLRLGPVKNRLETSGISFTEFSYQVLQSYDFLVLATKYDCLFQLGGSDQLGNIDAGARLIKSVAGRSASGVCLPLLTDRHNNKIGKSTAEKGDGVWLSSKKTSSFHLYQYFRQLHDDVAEKFFTYFSLRPFEEVNAIIAQGRENKGKWIVQKTLAEEVVLLVHGREDLEKAIRCSNVIYEGNLRDFEELDSDTIRSLFSSSSKSISRLQVQTVGDLADAIKEKSAYNHNLIRQGAFKLNGIKFQDPEERLDVTKVLLKDRYTLVNWGKRNYMVVDWID